MTDPTRQAGPPGGAGAVYSFPEIDAQCRKAARGVGFSWGLAEEAGRAARDLAEAGLPGPECLAVYLARLDTMGFDGGHPIVRDGSWGGRDGWLCPIALGAAFADRIALINLDGAWAFGGILEPLLALPILNRAVARAAIPLTVRADGARAQLDGGPLYLGGGWQDLTEAESFLIRPGAKEMGRPAAPPEQGREIDADKWLILERFAWRTYVPESAESRNRGAGDGS